MYVGSLMVGKQICTVEPLMPDASASVLEIAVVRLKTYESPSTEQITAELIQAGGVILRSVIL
jgi:hypothetical protein